MSDLWSGWELAAFALVWLVVGILSGLALAVVQRNCEGDGREPPCYDREEEDRLSF